MAVALFFFSCEDENAAIGLKNPNPKFDVAFVDIPLTSSVQLIDSIITDNKGGGGNVLVGKYQDNVFGTITAVPYLQIYPTVAPRIPDNAIFDSLTLSIRYNFYGYGFEGDRKETFTIHELIDPLDPGATRYRFNSTLAYSSPIGQTFVNVDSDSLKKQLGTNTNQQDTLIARARLDDALGKKIFDLAKAYSFVATTSNPPVTAEAQINDFLDKVRGLAFVPTESQAVLGLRISGALSNVTLHYRTLENNVVKDTLTRVMSFSTPSFTNIQADRSGTVFSGVLPYQSLSENSATGTRYIQAGNPVVTKLDLSAFYQFADTAGTVLLDEAALVIDGIETSSVTPAIGSLGLKVMNENNQFTNYSVATDRLAMTPYALTSTNQNGILLADGKHFVVKSDAQTDPPSQAGLVLNDGKYTAYITLFLQQLLKYSKDNNSRLKYLGLYAQQPSIASSVSRTVFDASKVKLRIFYTKPTLTTTP